MKKRLTKLIIIISILLTVIGIGAYYYINNSDQKNSADTRSITKTIEVDGKKIKVTVKIPKSEVPVRKIKTKADLALVTKDFEKLRDLTPAEYRK